MVINCQSWRDEGITLCDSVHVRVIIYYHSL